MHPNFTLLIIALLEPRLASLGSITISSDWDLMFTWNKKDPHTRLTLYGKVLDNANLAR